MNKNKMKRREEMERHNKEVSAKGKVKMIFHEPKFYNNPEVPMYEAGVEYDIEAHMVERWLKRGGEIVSELKEKAKEEPVKEVAPVDAEDKSEEKVDDEDLVEDEEEKKQDVAKDQKQVSKVVVKK